MKIPKYPLYLRKKGITPLIATFLLISFAAAVGVTVTNLGSAQADLQAQCAIDINHKLSQIGGQNEICYDAAKKDLSFTIENGVNIKIEGLLLNVIGKQKAETTELNDAKITKAGTYLGHAKFDSSASGEIRQVKIIPKVIFADNEQICTEKALVVENVKNC